MTRSRPLHYRNNIAHDRVTERYYGFRTEGETQDIEIFFGHPKEGIELLRRYAGRPSKWFRLDDEDERMRYEPFEGEAAKARVT